MTAIPQSKPTAVLESHVLPLENGDHLSRAEFERRYDAMPHLKKAELIEGVVYMGSPVRVNAHAAPHADIITWLGLYRIHTTGVGIADNGTVRLDDENEPQPDAMLWIQAKGQARVDDDDYLAGAPDLAVEVASSSVSFDMHAKKRVYQKHGVKEYVVWRVCDKAIDWFVLRDGQFIALEAKTDGYLESEVFPGLRLDPAALIQGDMQTVIQVLQEGLASPAHHDFVELLRRK